MLATLALHVSKQCVHHPHSNITLSFTSRLFKDGAEGISSDIQSEDCLTINVFRPSGLSDNASLPVLFWTYVFVHFLI